MPQEAAGFRGDGGRKIAEVVDRTGVSKELIHHYLRQGLLPASEEKARYSEHQERLLHLIRALREDHHLPLELIRKVFETFGFEPDDLEVLVLAEPLGKRVAGYGAERDLNLSPALTRDGLAAAAGVPTERIGEYLEQRVIEAVVEGGRERFTTFDANIIRLCERGVALGIPFDSFRTIATYMRAAFELERQAFFASLWGGDLPLPHLLNQVFVRRELVGSFVLNLLQAQEQRFLGDFLQRGEDRPARLDEVVYRPSEVFLRRHALRDEVDRRMARMNAGPDDAGAWLEIADVQLHMGWYREATFFLEQAVRRWPHHIDILMHHGMALALSGELDRGEQQLRTVLARGDPSPLAEICLALALFARLSSATDGAPLAAEIRELADGALEADGGLRVQLYGGWLLTALPPAFGDRARGLARLRAIRDELEQGSRRVPALAGLRERYRINTAALLLEAQGADDDELRDVIYRQDPACAFAERAFLGQRRGDGPGREEGR